MTPICTGTYTVIHAINFNGTEGEAMQELGGDPKESQKGSLLIPSQLTATILVQ